MIRTFLGKNKDGISKIDVIAEADKPIKKSPIMKIFKAPLEVHIYRIVILILVGAVIYLIKPMQVYQDLQKQEAFKAIEGKLSDTDKNPSVGIVGDNVVLPDADKLRAENAVMAQVYKDAKNGDIAIGYESKVFIYRPSSKQIIYEGSSPNSIVARAQSELASRITTMAITSKILPAGTTEAPQILILDNAFLQTAKPRGGIYEIAETGDVMFTYFISQVTLIYRPSTDKIIDSVKF
jgi:hypothetical protein